MIRGCLIYLSYSATSQLFYQDTVVCIFVLTCVFFVEYMTYSSGCFKTLVIEKRDM